MLPIIVIALRGEMIATMITAALSVIAFDFLYVPPQYSFHVHDFIYIWSFIIFFLVGYTITFQAKRIRTIEIKQLLVSTLSHDLKTPLSSILGNTTLLLDNKTIDNEMRHTILQQIKESSEQMDRLIGNLLDSARLKHSNALLQKEWYDLEDLVGVSLREFHDPSLQERLEINIDGDLAFFWCDGTLMVRLFVNLLENAIKYSGSDKHIRLDVESRGQLIHIAVFNESRPIPKDELDNIFERFYRLDNTADINGSGIGLAICKDIVIAHEGSITASNIEKGVVFDITLPVLKLPSETIIKEES
jgi:two-component system sensor histidine kinase KdpD